jgi:hypothetical protein
MCCLSGLSAAVARSLSGLSASHGGAVPDRDRRSCNRPLMKIRSISVFYCACWRAQGPRARSPD